MNKSNFSKSIILDRKKIGPGSSVFIIAEAGVNHCGDMNLAVKMIDAAAKAGADAIKFQSFKADSLILKDVEMAQYQKSALNSDKSQYKMLKELELNIENAEKLKLASEKAGLVFITTPFDLESLEEISRLELAAYKVASTDTTNIEFIKEIAKKNKPIIISTGMTYMSEISYVLQEVSKINRDMVLLQCSANYPLDNSEVNLNVINTFRQSFDCLVGFSDHTIGMEASQLSVGLGAVMVEKHFTLDKGFSGPDHAASLDQSELVEFVAAIRRAEIFMGSAIKMPTLSEIGTRSSLQKSIVALKKIRKGEIFDTRNLGSKRAGGKGISPIYISQLFGRVASQDYSPDDIIVR